MNEQSRVTAYKLGFLRKLAELGMTPSQWQARVKQAFVDPSSLAFDAIRGMSDIGGKAVGSGAEALKGVGGLAGQAAVYGPLALGAATGVARAALDAPSPVDIENLRKEEMITLYRRLANEINARRARKASMG